MIEQDGRAGRYRSCAEETCTYVENVRQGTKSGHEPGGSDDRWQWDLLDEDCPKCAKHRLKRGTPPASLKGERNPFIACQDRDCGYTRDAEAAAA